MINVMPIKDLKEHQEDSTCHCCPSLIMENGEMILVHNSFDGRESVLNSRKMVHARKDYDRFQDPENKIPEDEPVMLFRAQDRHFVSVLKYYADLLEAAGNFEVAKAVRGHILTAKNWRSKRDSVIKEPDL